MCDPPLRDPLLDLLVAGELDAANARLARCGGAMARIRIERVENARAADAAPVWRAEADGTQRFRFHVRSWGPHRRIIFERWLDMLPLMVMTMRAGPIGRVSLNLGDDGHRPGLAPCARGDGYTLVPDPMFLGTHGYASLRDRFAAQAAPWRDRARLLFWRGTTTGDAREADALPRVRACRLARMLGPGADVGLSAVTPAFAGAEARLRADGLMRPFVPPERFDRYQLHLDIDGNSNSWSGLFTKLLSGSPVLKVASAAGYRQWYYPRLQPWVNFAPVRADLADLADVARYLLADPARAAAIGAAGRSLARDLTFDGEIARAVPAILAAFEPA